MINGIQLKRLRHSECLQMMQDTLEILKDYGTGDTLITKHHLALQQITNRLEAVFKRPSEKATEKKIQGVRLSALDKRRTAAIQGFCIIVKGYTFHADEVQRNHAYCLQAWVGTHITSIARMNYQEKSTWLRVITLGCQQQPALMAALASLRLSEWVAELAAANQLFEEAFLETTGERALASGETFSQLRPQAHEAWYELCHQLNAHALVYKDKGKYSQAIEHMNGLLESYRPLAAGRRAGKKAKALEAKPKKIR